MSDQIAQVIGYVVLAFIGLGVVGGAACGFWTSHDFDKFVNRYVLEIAELKNEIAELKRAAPKPEGTK